MRQIAKNMDEQCPARRRGRRCKFVAGHTDKHEDELGKRWPESRLERKLRGGKNV